jgi:endonuclease/exonuclease/phosphatase family metal-dependent hydrolase
MKSIAEIFYRSPQNDAAAERLCIISHNVFWFQGVPFATDTPPAPRSEIAGQLCLLYKKICPDVLCLQEIQSEATARMVAEILEMEYLFCAGGGLAQYGNAVFSRWPMEEMPLQQSILPDRTLLRVTIYPKESQAISLVNVHLPSNRQRGAEGGQRRRLEELSGVLDQADILLGDFNELPDGRCASLLTRAEYVDAAQACSAGASPSTLGEKRGDHIWIAKDKINLLQGYFFIPKEQLALCGTEKTFLSDHLPVGCLLDGSQEK